MYKRDMNRKENISYTQNAPSEKAIAVDQEEESEQES